ncbi:Intersectin 1 (SH3 domain protein), partial [Kappamyces sp. JEL0680]
MSKGLQPANLDGAGPNPFGSSAMIFTPSASDFPVEEETPFQVEDGPEDARRREAISELISTERSYVDDLFVVKDMFFLPLSQMQLDMQLLFSNFLQITEVNAAILRDFEGAKTSAESLGAIFLRHLDALQCYKIYCQNLDVASNYLQKIRTSNPRIAEFLKTQQNRPVCKHLDLSSYLLIPMQRITRYSLLLRQILHYTAKTHPEYDATLIALQLSEEFLDQINNAIKEAQSIVNIERISKLVDLEIPSELDLHMPTRTLGNRLFLHEGVLQKNKSGRKLLAYLFNDFILLAQSKSGSKPYGLYRKPLLIEGVTIGDAVRLPSKDTGPIDNTCFQIGYENEIITLRASNVSEKRQWINLVDIARKNYQTFNLKAASLSKPAADTIGTLNLILLSASHCLDPGKFREVFAAGRIKEQVLKSKIVDAARPVFNQSLIFTIATLDDSLQISLYSYDKYSADVYLGQAEIQLDFLEYYAGKQTEVIKLSLKDGGYEHLSIKMVYKPT